MHIPRTKQGQTAVKRCAPRFPLVHGGARHECPKVSYHAVTLSPIMHGHLKLAFMPDVRRPRLAEKYELKLISELGNCLHSAGSEKTAGSC